MAAFGTKHINYHEDRADGGFAWDVKYDLTFQNNEVLTELDVKLVGANAGATATQWENGVNTIWNNKVFFNDGARLYEVKMDFDFVTSGQHHTVNVHAGTGGTNMTNWYLTNPSGWSNDMQDEIAAHEAGHMFGNFDEYAGGATYNGYTTTGTIMSDLTLSGFQNYFWTQEYYTEQYGNMSLSSQMGINGTSGANTLYGTSGMNGFYALGGNDVIYAGGGNDLIDGGMGRDTMYGQSGRDYFDYDSRYETGNSASTRDKIMDFKHGTDKIDLSGMDASTYWGGNQAFNFIGTSSFHSGLLFGTGGEIRYQKFNYSGTANDKTVIYGDVDTDGSSEFQIELKGLVTLSASDFIL
ncbi:MAG: M10 family metallopeptidase C-terminal domain-containing protein [Hyphomicrobiaceae bacterium]